MVQTKSLGAGARAFSVGHGEGRRAGLIRLPLLKPGANRHKCGAKSTPARFKARAAAKMSAIAQKGRTGRPLDGAVARGLGAGARSGPLANAGRQAQTSLLLLLLPLLPRLDHKLPAARRQLGQMLLNAGP
jgi:hypothetical protein